MILSQAAPFDIATTSGIAQSVTLRFLDGNGTAKDISGNTFRCAVRGPGATAIKCEPVDANTALLLWSPLKAGTHAYDLFMISTDGGERPLIKGEIHAAPRVTPPGNEDVVTIGDIKIIVPDAADGEIKIVDPAVDAAERAEGAAQKAEIAGTNAETARRDAEAALKLANDAAVTAQKALAAMPLPDGNGNITVPGNVFAQGASFASAVNANGGISIPLAVGAPTDTAAVNRIHAAGMAIVGETSSIRLYLDASTATNNAVMSAPVANQVLRVSLQAGMTTTVHVNLAPGILAYNNYSSFAGIVLPVRLTSASKITFAMGKIAVTANDDLPLDAYTLTPASQITTFGEILDITFTTDRDAAAGGYHVRVREIYWSKNAGKWLVKTTQSLLVLSGNVPIPGCVARIVYQQYAEGGLDTDERGALWLIVTGGNSQTCQKIATVRGIHNYESFGLRDYYLNITNPASYPVGAVVEAATVMTAWDNALNPAYYGFSAIETNAIQSETVEDFAEPEQPTA